MSSSPNLFPFFFRYWGAEGGNEEDGGTFKNAMPGTFVPAAGGTFETAMGGTFVSATGGTFETVMGGTFVSAAITCGEELSSDKQVIPLCRGNERVYSPAACYVEFHGNNLRCPPR